MWSQQAKKLLTLRFGAQFTFCEFFLNNHNFQDHIRHFLIMEINKRQNFESVFFREMHKLKKRRTVTLRGTPNGRKPGNTLPVKLRLEIIDGCARRKLGNNYLVFILDIFM